MNACPSKNCVQTKAPYECKMDEWWRSSSLNSHFDSLNNCPLSLSDRESKKFYTFICINIIKNKLPAAIIWRMLFHKISQSWFVQPVGPRQKNKKLLLVSLLLNLFSLLIFVALYSFVIKKMFSLRWLKTQVPHTKE